MRLPDACDDEFVCSGALWLLQLGTLAWYCGRKYEWHLLPFMQPLPYKRWWLPWE